MCVCVCVRAHVVHMQVCVGTCGYMPKWICKYLHACVCGGQRSPLCVFHKHSQPLFLKAGSLAEPEVANLARQAGQQAPETRIAHLTFLGVQMHSAVLIYSCRCGGVGGVYPSLLSLTVIRTITNRKLGRTYFLL